jgi:hypothetical protein
MKFVAGASWGNDTIATVQFLHERGVIGVLCLYNDTGWPMPPNGDEEGWLDRVARMERWAHSLGYQTDRTVSIGMEALVHHKKAWPRQGMQFCTEALKLGPTLKWLAERDPEKALICVNGKRAAESQERSDTVEWVEESPLHGGRLVWQPLYAHTAEMRDALILRAGHAVLPHKSRECMLCVNTGRKGLLAAPEVAVAWVERVEHDLGYTSNGKPRTMFRPARKMGATGIREVVDWAKSARGKYNSAQLDLLDDGDGPNASQTGCDGGLCET